MKIVMVAIPNHHFFQWVNQLERSGYEVFWFDVTDGGGKVDRIQWVKQIKGWKLKYNFRSRHFVKNKLPRIYKVIQKFNERKVEVVFEKMIHDIQPDIVHCFEMRLAGFPILDVMLRHRTIPFVYSSWGSDMFYFEQLGVRKQAVERFLNRVDYFIADCKRDYRIALQNGFNGVFLGDYIGNGGLAIEQGHIKKVADRTIIMIKGYDDGVGKAVKVLEAIEELPIELFSSYELVVYSADVATQKFISNSDYFKKCKVRVLQRGSFVANTTLLKIMGSSVIHIGNSLSDGMPNALLEAMGMGAFPIQSNPGGVSEEVITDGVNGLVIKNPLDTHEIANIIQFTILNEQLRANAQVHNVAFVFEKYNRDKLKIEIVGQYESIYQNKKS